jgi:hypothetical protein
LDDPNLAIRLGHRCVCIFDALQMVSSWSVMKANCACNDRQRRQDCLRHVQNLAHGKDLMFDHNDARCSAFKKHLW